MIRFIPEFGIGRGIWYGIFHSISAFCNAGFDLMGENGAYQSLIRYSDDWLVNTVIMLLIIIGGIGFLVWDDLSVKKFQWEKISSAYKDCIINNWFSDYRRSSFIPDTGKK